jgi:hypothetical protein
MYTPIYMSQTPLFRDRSNMHTPLRTLSVPDVDRLGQPGEPVIIACMNDNRFLEAVAAWART